MNTTALGVKWGQYKFESRIEILTHFHVAGKVIAVFLNPEIKTWRMTRVKSHIGGGGAGKN